MSSDGDRGSERPEGGPGRESDRGPDDDRLAASHRPWASEGELVRRGLIGRRAVLGMIGGGVVLIGAALWTGDTTPDEPEDDGGDDASGGGAGTADAGAGIDAEPQVIMVMTPLAGGFTFRLERSPTRRQPWWAEDRFPDLFRFRADAAGRWLAALGPGAEGGDQRGLALFRGPIDGDLTRIDEGIAGYAWHDRAPGRMAVTTVGDTAGPGRIERRDVQPDEGGAGDDGFVPIPLPTTERGLRAWGDWGFALGQGPTPTGDVDTITVLDPTGRVLITDEPGIATGVVAGDRLVVSPAGERTRPVLLHLADGAVEEPEWLPPTAVVHRVVPSNDGLLTAVHLTEIDAADQGGAAGESAVLVIDADGRPIASIPGAANGAISWDPTGTRMLVVRDDARRGTALVRYDASTGRFREWPLPGLDPLAHRTDVVVLAP